jgi:hypothetical protein
MNPFINQNSYQINPIKAAIILTMGLIICLTLATSYFKARGIASDRIRIGDITLIGKFLEAYKTNEGQYPAAVSGLPSGWEQYLEKLPTPPKASGDCSETQNKYTYAPLNDRQDYSLSFCLGRKIGDYKSGPNSARPVK